MAQKILGPKKWPPQKFRLFTKNLETLLMLKTFFLQKEINKSVENMILKNWPS